ncbi:MAG: hypothetical protein MUE98_13675 [Rhodobacteraceae bacterium]|nr:hypothetical protein [Paracoccaceae bacterium]
MGKGTMTAADRGAALLLFAAGLMLGGLGPGALGTAHAIMGGALLLAFVVFILVSQLLLVGCLHAASLTWRAIRRRPGREDPPPRTSPRRRLPAPPALRLAFPAGLVLGVGLALLQAMAWAHDISGRT